MCRGVRAEPHLDFEHRRTHYELLTTMHNVHFMHPLTHCKFDKSVTISWIRITPRFISSK